MLTATEWENPQFRDFLAAYGYTAEKTALASLFLPGVLEKRFEAFDRKIRFAHYTTAEAAVAIIRNKCVWLRNANAMNDYSELHHGVSRILSFFRDEAAKPFWLRLGALHEGLDNELKSLYDGWLNDLRFNTYMMCVSEHKTEEDRLGRLSMWRAYGQPNGVCAVFNGTPFHNSSEAVKTYSYPVLYWTDEKIKDAFGKIVDAVCALEGISLIPKDTLRDYAYHMLETFSIGLKHPGFGEEVEWRVVHRPGTDSSERVPCSVQTIRSVPQRVYSLPLANVESEGLHGLAIPEVLDRIIVGPCQHPLIVNEALVDVLNSVGVVDAASKVIISDIPLRT